MKIRCTGAEVVKVGNEYQVLFHGKVVFSSPIRACAVMSALTVK